MLRTKERSWDGTLKEEATDLIQLSELSMAVAGAPLPLLYHTNQQKLAKRKSEMRKTSHCSPSGVACGPRHGQRCS